MTGSVSDLVRKSIDSSPSLKELLAKGLLSLSSYAIHIQPEIEHAAGKSVRSAAIIMALRRYAEDLRLESRSFSKPGLTFKINMATDINSINFRTNGFTQPLRGIKSGFLNVIIGTQEACIIYSAENHEFIKALIEPSQILSFNKDLVALSLIFNGGFDQTPGIIYESARQLAWADINVIEIISTKTELTFVIKRTDSLKTYEILQSFKPGL
ncbi:MAG: hypothetical protein PHI83_00690 [Sphaerochaetaceae bacterium]|jgi:hypothetical protein|nr:hypothetical protein [Sphaerochaetaceae bacterium]